MEINLSRDWREMAKTNIPVYSIKDEWTLYPIGDIHYENKGCDRVALRKTIRAIQENPRALAIIMGDCFDGIPRDDKRFRPNISDFDTSRESIWQDAVMALADELRPIRDKILGVHMGNHEMTILTRYDVDLIKMLVDDLNNDLVSAQITGPLERRAWLHKLSHGNHPRAVRYYDYCAMTRLRFMYKKTETEKSSSNFVTIWSHHGSGGGNTEGAALNKLVQQPVNFVADVYISGHHHKTPSTKTSLLYLDETGRLREKKRVFVKAPSYLRSYEVGRSDYAERSLHSPAYIGHSAVLIKPFNGKFSEVELNLLI
jgi:hypothetical protein